MGRTRFGSARSAQRSPAHGRNRRTAPHRCRAQRDRAVLSPERSGSEGRRQGTQPTPEPGTACSSRNASSGRGTPSPPPQSPPVAVAAPFLPPPPRTPALTPRSASLCGSRSRTPPFIMGQGGASRRRPGFPPPPPPAVLLLSGGVRRFPSPGAGPPSPPPPIGAARTPVWNAGRRLQRDAGPPPRRSKGCGDLQDGFAEIWGSRIPGSPQRGISVGRCKSRGAPGESRGLVVVGSGSE